MSANVLDMVINDATVPEGIWWEKDKGQKKAIRITGDESTEELITLMDWNWKPGIAQLRNPVTDKFVDAFEIFRDDNMSSLGIVKAEKVDLPPSPREIVDWLNQARHTLSAKWSTAGMTTTSKLWGQLAVDGSVDLGDGDIVENRLMMYYDYKTRSGKVKSCITNIVCENTLCMSLSEKHNGRVDYDFGSLNDKAISQLSNKMGIANRKFDETVEKYKTLQSRPVDLTDSREITTYAYMLDTAGLLEKCIANHDLVTDLLSADSRTQRLRTNEMGTVGKSVLTAIVAGMGQDLEARKDNWYGAFQGVTFYSDHVSGRNESTRQDSAYFGQKAELKEQALEAALIMSSVR